MVPLLNAEMTSRENLYIHEILIAWARITPYMIIFIINNNILAPLYLIGVRRLVKFILYNLLVIVVIFWWVDWFQVNIFDDHYIVIGSTREPVLITELEIYWNLFFALMMVTANCGIKYIYKSIRDEQTMNELRNENMQVEMDYLKYQINPHFFMNTLNNIHALIDIDTESAKSAVIDLSKMMRYVLYESGSGVTTLRQDLEFINNYIDLMRIRYDDEVKVSIYVDDNLPLNTSIPPLLLIVFVENAFKHGVGGDGESYINLTLSCKRSLLIFSVENSIANKEVERGGIGLKNVRKRLDLLYKDNSRLITKRRGDSYRVELTIPINA